YSFWHGDSIVLPPYNKYNYYKRSGYLYYGGIYMDFTVDNYLENLYANTNRQLAFNANNMSEWKVWHCELKDAFLKSLGKFPLAEIELEPQLLEEVDCGNYIRQRVLYNIDQDLLTPAYVLVPKD